MMWSNGSDCVSTSDVGVNVIEGEREPDTSPFAALGERERSVKRGAPGYGRVANGSGGERAALRRPLELT